MKTALVLSGGGAKGAYQAGVITQLIEKGITFDCVAGVSVGSLNGAMVAQDKIDEIIHIWHNIEEEDVFIKKNYLQMIWRNTVGGYKSIYDAAPLLRIIQQNIHLQDMKIPFYIGLTSLENGKYYSVDQDCFEYASEFQNAVYASSLMPILWEPITVKTKINAINQAVDGGLRNVTPIKDIIKKLPDIVYLVNCSTGEVPEKHSKNIIQVAMRTFTEIMLSEIVINDLKGILHTNMLIKQAGDKGFELINPYNNKPYKYFEIHHIQPSVNLGSPIDFSRTSLDKNFDLGYKQII